MKRASNLEKLLKYLSIKALGTDIPGQARNESQITDVAQTLWAIQNIQKGLELELVTPDNNVSVEDIEAMQEMLAERSDEFKRLAQICLSSYDDLSNDDLSKITVSTHLKEMQKLYDASEARTNELLSQKAQALQINANQTRRLSRDSAEVARKDFENLEVPNTQPTPRDDNAKKIVSNINTTYAHISKLNKEYSQVNEGHTKEENLTSRLKVLGEINKYVAYLKNLKMQLQSELECTNMPVDEQRSLLSDVEQLIDNSKPEDGTSQLIEDVPPELPVNQLEPAAIVKEETELRTEITQIKNQIGHMVQILNKEIPGSGSEKKLKTHKRDTLLRLSEKLNVTEKSSLEEIKTSIKMYKEELQTSQKDTIFRQGVFKHRCRTLTDKLSKELESETHVFNRPKR